MDNGAGPVRQDALRSLLGYNFKRSYMRIHRDIRATLAGFDLTQRTFSVLSVVAETPGISQSEISRALEIERSGTVVIVDGLEGRGLIQRDKVPGDRRAYALTVTSAGSDLHARALAALRACEDRIFGTFTPQERAHLRALLDLIQNEEQPDETQ
ncbi:MarR family transcriptional regulator [Aquicoccus sp. SCR17]|nr:MarR family transcriptional regulator [Carideicomes alvinocaridis]